MRFYDKRKKAIINTRTAIPEELLVKKTFLLPVETTSERVEDGKQPLKKAGLEILDDKVIEHKVHYFKVLTLDEEKEKKINELKEYMSVKFPPMFKQVNALLGEYGEEKDNEIKKQVSDLRAYIDKFESQILAATTKEEIYKINFTLEDGI